MPRLLMLSGLAGTTTSVATILSISVIGAPLSIAKSSGYHSRSNLLRHFPDSLRHLCHDTFSLPAFISRVDAGGLRLDHFTVAGRREATQKDRAHRNSGLPALTHATFPRPASPWIHVGRWMAISRGGSRITVHLSISE